MQPLSTAPAYHFRDIRFVLTDMDETLTRHGRLSARTYTALERLQSAGIRVVPVTAAPSGWADQMARMWPVDGVIAENGGIFLARTPDGHGVTRRYWAGDATLATLPDALRQLAAQVRDAVPEARLADDQPFRLTSVAFRRTLSAAQDESIVAAFRQTGAHATINNLWVLGWFGGYDKLSMSRRVLRDAFELDIDDAAQGRVVLYSGDSLNDAPMFSFFDHTVGVSTVRDYLSQLPRAPAWITEGPGGDGFVEMVNRVLGDRVSGHVRA